MGYSRRFRFADGKSSLHRVEFARAFETRLAGSVRPEEGRPDVAEPRSVEAPADQTHTDDPAAARDQDAERAVPDDRPRGRPAPML